MKNKTLSLIIKTDLYNRILEQTETEKKSGKKTSVTAKITDYIIAGLDKEEKILQPNN